MKVCGARRVRVYYFPVPLFHRFTLTSQVQHDNELYFCDRRGRILWVRHCRSLPGRYSRSPWA